jgi:hypothetical protein
MIAYSLTKNAAKLLDIKHVGLEEVPCNIAPMSDWVLDCVDTGIKPVLVCTHRISKFTLLSSFDHVRGLQFINYEFGAHIEIYLKDLGLDIYNRMLIEYANPPKFYRNNDNSINAYIGQSKMFLEFYFEDHVYPNLIPGQTIKFSPIEASKFINNRPIKGLGFKKPLEVFAENCKQFISLP